MKPLFNIIFTDGTSFIGGDYESTKWLEIPQNKKIRSIFYLLPSGDYLALGGYYKYYHMLEVTEDLNGERRGTINFEFDYIMGRREEYTTIYKINLKTSEINITDLNNKDEFFKKLNPQGWR